MVRAGIVERAKPGVPGLDVKPVVDVIRGPGSKNGGSVVLGAAHDIVPVGSRCPSVKLSGTEAVCETCPTRIVHRRDVRGLCDAPVVTHVECQVRTSIIGTSGYSAAMISVW